MFCCCVTDGSRGAVWQHGAWHGSEFVAKVCHWIPSCGGWKKMALVDFHWCLLNIGSQTVDVSSVRRWAGWCISAVVTEAVNLLCWCRLLWAWHAGSCLSLAKTNKQKNPHQTCVTTGDDSEKWCFVAEYLLYQVTLFALLLLILK